MSLVTKLYARQGGQWLCDFEADVTGVLWRLGATGAVQFSVDYSNPVAAAEKLRMGNRLLVQFTCGLPDWGGVLDYTVVHAEDHLELNAYEADRLLDWRVSQKTEAFSSTSPGAIVTGLLQNANGSWYPTGIEMGDVYTGGSHTREFHYENLLHAVQGLVADTGYDYAVIPSVVNGKMYLDLHWYECRGSDLRDSVALVEGEGGNIGVATVTDYGPVYNKIIVVGKGTSWANAPVKTAVSVESISKNGLREYVAYYSDISDEATLQAIADALLAQLAFPRRRISIDQTLDRDPAPFSAYHVGDIVTLDCLHKAGDFAFKGPVRILARQWSPGDVVGLELEEWND